MGAAGTRGQQRSRRRAARPRPARGRVRPAAHAPAGRRLLDRRGALGRDRGPPARRHPRRAAPGRLAAALLRPAATSGCRSSGAPRRASTGSRCVFAAIMVPVAFWAGWSLFGRRTAWIAALLAAVNPFLTDYAQEGRMYALVALLAMVALGCWLQAFTTDGDGVRRGAGDRVRGRPRGDALHAQLGVLLRRGDRDRVAVAAVARGARRAAAAVPHRARRLRRRDPALPAVAAHRALPGDPHRRAVVARAVARDARLGPGADPRRRRRGRRPARRRGRRRRAAADPSRAALPRDRRAAGDRGADDRPRLARVADRARLGGALPRGRRARVRAARRGRVRARRAPRPRRPRDRRRPVGGPRRAGREEQRARRRRGDRAVAAPRRPRGGDPARAGLRARLLPARTACASGRSPGRSPTRA